MNDRVEKIREDRARRQHHELRGEGALGEADNAYNSATVKAMFAARATAHFTAAMYYLRKGGHD